MISDTDELEDRALFVQEYNRLAKKHGVRVLVVEDFAQKRPEVPEKRGWLHRMLQSSSENRRPQLSKPSIRPSQSDWTRC
ncbi:hypothetical protein N3K66_007107 [Trichothecium roseum]|uniref:Uncharacterized protein n=1 Tax=Trichothecium roseum TaxID=47278 RepID=A0ACC0UX78_9HYPO|nr:hypothetical protein N3K66_007107 [Trichothecium roseum]